VPVLDADGHVTDVKRDDRGAVVRSRLDEDLLRTLAQRTHGAYFAANRPGGELGRLLGAIESLARTSRRQRLAERPVPRFPLFAALAALLLGADLVRQRRSRAREAAAPMARARGAAAAAAVLALLVVPSLARAQSAWERGNRAFAKGKFTAADSLYAQRLRRGGPDAVRVNRATAQGLAGGGEAAERELDRLAGAAGAAGDAARYNLGTLQADRHDDEEALAALRRALRANPGDADARWNYEVVLRRIQDQQQKQQQKQKSGGGGGGGQQPQPSQPQQQQQQGQPPPQPSPSQQQPQQAPPQPNSARNGAMTKEQADRLLNALQDLARSEQQKREPVRTVQERRGRDW